MYSLNWSTSRVCVFATRLNEIEMKSSTCKRVWHHRSWYVLKSGDFNDVTLLTYVKTRVTLTVELDRRWQINSTIFVGRVGRKFHVPQEAVCSEHLRADDEEKQISSRNCRGWHGENTLKLHNCFWRIFSIGKYSFGNNVAKTRVRGDDRKIKRSNFGLNHRNHRAPHASHMSDWPEVPIKPLCPSNALALYQARTLNSQQLL